MLSSKNRAQDALEQLEWALERYLQEVVNPENETHTPGSYHPEHRKLLEECSRFQNRLMEAQVDRILTGAEARLIAINLLLTSFESDNLRRADSGMIVRSEEWEKLRQERAADSGI